MSALEFFGPAPARMRGFSRFLLAALLVATAWPTPVRAQGSDCRYETCALRLDPGGFFSGSSIVRGADGSEVADYEPSAALEQIFLINDSAAVSYNQFAKSHRSAMWLYRAGGLLYLSAALVPFLLDRSDSSDALYIGLSLGGVGFGMASIAPRQRASRSMSRAIWWYNGELSR